MRGGPHRSGSTLDGGVAALTEQARAAGLDAIQSGRAVWRTIAGELLGASVEAERLDRWFGAPALLREKPALVAPRPLPEDVIASFERTAPLRMPGTSKRDTGTYYTPPDLAEFLVEQALAQLAARGRPATAWRVVDPASGAGIFGITLIRRLVPLLVETGLRDEEARDHAVRTSLHLVDADPLAVALARCLVLLEVGPTPEAAVALEQHVVCGDAVIGGPAWTGTVLGEDATHWLRTFSDVFEDGGFDAVVGNPPWGAIKPSVREYAATVDINLLRLDGPSLRANLDRSAGDRSAPEAATRSYAIRLRSSGYAHQGAGDTEFYRYFLELAHGLVRPHGVIGLLIPSAFQRAAGAAPLRRLLLDDGTIEFWLDFLNSRGIFPIHRMFRFALLVWRQGDPGGVANLRLGITTVQEAEAALRQPPVTLSPTYLAEVSRELRTIPDVRSTDDARLYARLHAVHPGLGEDVAGAWRVRFRRELDMTNDAHLFIPSDRALREGARPTPDGAWSHPDLGVLLPVFEGRMVHQFDAAAKGHIEGHGRSARWELLGPGNKDIRPRFLLPAEEAERRAIRFAPRASFCDVTGHANERTVLAAVVPAVAVCGNKVPTCDFEDGDEDVAYLWASIANSFVVDWVARRRVSTTLNYFHWYELPFPRLDAESDAGRRLVAAARALSANPGRPWTTSLNDRARLRADIDVEVLRLYGLDVRDAAVILADFPLLDRGAPDGHDSVTRDLVLAQLARATGAADLRLSDIGLDAGGGPELLKERVDWHSAAGATAYVPGEFARTGRRSA